MEHIAVNMPKDRKGKKQFLDWYNKEYGIKLSGGSSCYLIPYVFAKSCGARVDRYFPHIPRITFEQWKQQYCPETYNIY